ncbi:MAG: NAD(P)-dependent oxidoreductase [Phycisphaeraceae bacterium]|nr:NAD(P)-dependent oxidoreductase [Phycisphaeraceae bacterium]
MKVLIAGGSGYLGRHIAAALLRAGHSVRVLDLKLREDAGEIEQIQADLLTDEHLERAFDGIDVLVHLAAALRGDARELIRTTVEGTRRLLDAMSRTSCRRLVLCSSMSVYDWSQVGSYVDETSPVLREQTMGSLDGYAQSKTLQEWLVRDKTVEHDWALTVLRPAVLHGDGVDGAFVLGRKFGSLQLVIAPSSPARLVHVDSAALAFVKAIERESEQELILNVLDDPTVTRWQYAGQVRGLRVPMPYGCAMCVAKLASMLTGHSTRLPYFLQPRRVEALHKPVSWSNKQLRHALNWQPREERKEPADG